MKAESTSTKPRKSDHLRLAVFEIQLILFMGSLRQLHSALEEEAAAALIFGVGQR